MKKLILITLMATSFMVKAGSPPVKQKVHPYVKEKQSLEWYEEQMSLWGEEVQTNNVNADGWLNFYTATRMVRFMGGQRNQNHLNSIVTQMEKAIPNTFEFNYSKYWNSDDLVRDFSYLQKAELLGPNRMEVMDDFITYYELKRDHKNVKKYCIKWYNGNDISNELFTLNRAILSSCDSNGILITNGDNDTYPAFVLQYAKDFQANVMVLNISLLLNKDYQNRCFKELGIPILDKTISSSGSILKYKQDICGHIQEHSDRPFYYASTVAPNVYQNVIDKLVPVGMAFKYSNITTDIIEMPSMDGYVLGLAYPNPVTTGTAKIDFVLGAQEIVTIELHNSTGQTVKRFELGNKPAGKSSIELDISDLQAGLYFYKFIAGKYKASRQLQIM
jgi:hypothetical protein